MVGANTFIIVRIMEPFWFFAGIITVLPMLERQRAATEPLGETQPAKLAAGQRVYRAGNVESQVAACAACHGPSGRGNPGAAYPSIQGQHATYTAAQLRAYRKGERATDPNQMMRNIAAGLSDEEIDAVASYVQGLR